MSILDSGEHEPGGVRGRGCHQRGGRRSRGIYSGMLLQIQDFFLFFEILFLGKLVHSGQDSCCDEDASCSPVRGSSPNKRSSRRCPILKSFSANVYTSDPQMQFFFVLFCWCGEEKEEESHLISGDCEIYGDIRRKYGDLDDDNKLVKFFNEVLARRDELEKEEDKRNSID